MDLNAYLCIGSHALHILYNAIFIFYQLSRTCVLMCSILMLPTKGLPKFRSRLRVSSPQLSDNSHSFSIMVFVNSQSMDTCFLPIQYVHVLDKGLGFNGRKRLMFCCEY